jgi:hypothetical protein
MTLTLELAPEVEAALQSEAARLGQSLPDFAAAQLAEIAHTVTPQRTPRRRTSGFGKFAGLGVSSAEVAEDRRAEVEADERAFQERLERQAHRKRAA